MKAFSFASSAAAPVSGTPLPIWPGRTQATSTQTPLGCSSRSWRSAFASARLPTEASDEVPGALPAAFSAIGGRGFLRPPRLGEAGAPTPEPASPPMDGSGASR